MWTSTHCQLLTPAFPYSGKAMPTTAGSASYVAFTRCWTSLLDLPVLTCTFPSGPVSRLKQQLPTSKWASWPLCCFNWPIYITRPWAHSTACSMATQLFSAQPGPLSTMQCPTLSPPTSHPTISCLLPIPYLGCQPLGASWCVCLAYRGPQILANGMKSSCEVSTLLLRVLYNYLYN